MKLGYRTGRNILFLILGFIAVSLKSNINGLSFYFGVAALSSAGLTLVYILLHFDENISREIITEMVIDGFSGLIIFTYPNSNNEFYMVIFSFWLAVMGTLMVPTYIATIIYFFSILFANRDKVKDFFNTFKSVPGPSDITVVHYFKYLFGIRKVPPYWDEWIWVDKFDLWAEAWGIFAMGVTGLILWMPEIFTGFIPLPSETIQIAYIVHLYEATLALGWIALVHLYMTHFGPKKFPMDWVWLTGVFPEVEMVEERPKAYRRIIKAVAEKQPELLEKYPFLRERYEFVLEVERLPEEEMIEKMHEFAHHLLEHEVTEGEAV
jgi:cytochrome b subunit of formate dehydrogenase